MKKSFCLILLITLNISYSVAEIYTPPYPKNDSIDELFEKAEIDTLPKPVYHEPSAVSAWFRERGISILYKYYDFKAWISKKMGLI